MEERGVTPVLGEIILISIAIGLAASVGLVVYSWVSPSGYGPHVALILRAENFGGDNGDNVRITIIHQGGEILNRGDLRVLAEDENGTIEVNMKWLDNAKSSFSLDDTVVWNYHYGSNPHGKEIDVKVVHDPSRTIVLSVAALVVSGG